MQISDLVLLLFVVMVSWPIVAFLTFLLGYFVVWLIDTFKGKKTETLQEAIQISLGIK